MAEISISKVRYTHDAIIDEIIAFPSISQGELCKLFGFTQSWMSIIVNSDAFKNRLTERKAELVDPKIQASVNERLEALAKRSLDKLLDRLDTNLPFSNGDLIAAAKLGVGSAPVVNPFAQTNNYIVQMPPPAQTAKAWIENSPRAQAVQDISPRGLAD